MRQKLHQFFLLGVLSFLPLSCNTMAQGEDITSTEVEKIYRIPSSEEMLKKLYHRYDQYFKNYVKEMSDMDEMYVNLATERYAQYRRSVTQWETMKTHLLAWARLRGGAGELWQPLTSDALENSLSRFERALAEQRLIEVFSSCGDGSGNEMTLAASIEKLLRDGEAETRRKYGNKALENDERASGSQYDMTTLSTDMYNHYEAMVKKAYQQRRDAVMASSVENKKELIKEITACEKSFLIYVESCGQIVASQDGSMWPAVAGMTMEQMLVWHLRDLDRYFPL